MDVEGVILNLSPDKFARWVAYFKIKQKEQEKARSKQASKAKASPSGGRKFRGR